MKAGKKLDEMVAEHVIGWSLREGQWYDPSGDTKKTLLPFSTDVTTAWQVAERIFELERGFRLQLDGSKLWQARFYKSTAHTLETRAFLVTGGTPAEAICLAALAVRGITKPQ
jgi:hypothetical protein